MTTNERSDKDTGRQPAHVPANCCPPSFAAAGAESSICAPPVMTGVFRQAGEGSRASAACPMATMCQGMMAGGPRGLALLMLLPASILLALGASVLLAPQILPWLAGGGLVLVGGLILLGVFLVRKAGRHAA